MSQTDQNNSYTALIKGKQVTFKHTGTSTMPPFDQVTSVSVLNHGREGQSMAAIVYLPSLNCFGKPHANTFNGVNPTPLNAIDFKGKDAIQVTIPKMRPFTLHGLCLYLDVNTGYFNDFEKGLKENQVDKDFSAIITRIKETIYDQKFSGAIIKFSSHMF